MANPNAAIGFRATKHLAGGLPNRFNRYHIATALASNIARGDAVIPTATSKNVDRPGGATVRLVGVFDGVIYVDANGDTQFRPRWASGQTTLANSVIDCFVYDDPKTLFEVQYSATLALADIGSFGDLVIGVSNASTGQSADTVNNAGVGTNIKIQDIVGRPENDYGLNAKIIVQIALHYNAGAPTAI